ncbi:MAG: aminopeptidase N [Colwellia sp.]|nr:aminopeptidase N [Colwellia sp.]
MTDFKTLYLADYQSPEFSIETVDLTFELSDRKTIVTSILNIKRVGKSTSPLILNGQQLTLIRLKLNNIEMTSEKYHVNDEYLEVNTTQDNFTLMVVTEINPIENTSLEGLYKSGEAFCTQCEAEGFRRITYYLDRPDIMAIFTCKIIADKQHFPSLLSNGNKIDSGDLANGQHFVQWHDPFPKPSYLFAVVAGSFDLLTDKFVTMSGKEVDLEIYVDKGNLSKTAHAMQALKNSMRWDEETFCLEYDLDVYMIVAVDFFNMGAMENKGLNVFNSKFVLADEKSATDIDYFNIEAVIGHEYFHNWTGNRVTCRDWFQLSLKEGLTVFRDQQFSADMNSTTVTRIRNVRHLRALQFAEDAGPMSHPIRPEKVVEMNNFYTLTVYEKGAEVIRMIHTLLGTEGFNAGMALYFKRFDGQAVTCDDFVDAMTDASGVDLTQFKRWYSQSGTPILTVSTSFDQSSEKFSLTISQNNSQNNNEENLPLHVPINIELINHNGQSSESHLLELTEAKKTWLFDSHNEEPIVAFLAGFSAPVNVDFTQTDEELSIIITHATDGFCRWDAGQKLMINYIKILTLDINISLPINLLDMFRSILKSASGMGCNIDKAFIAEQLVLPTFDEVCALIDEVDPIALLTALEKLKLFIIQGLETEFLNCYHHCSELLSTETKEEVATRALKNTCLSYLALLPDQIDLVESQFSLATNMTDTLAALQSSASNNLICFESQMQSFEQIWSETALVMDKWFILNASLSSELIFDHLESLLKHPLFSLKNPNRARSLIGAFTAHNPKYFHCITGRGYQFLGKQITLLNSINPQVASRLITPLIQYKSVDKQRQQLMKVELVKLKEMKGLSKDLLEKLNAAIS